jgi:hypothetical protein
MKMSKTTCLILTTLGLATVLAARAGTLASGFSSTTFNNNGTLPWGSHTDHGSEYYQSWDAGFSGGGLTIHSIYNSGGHKYESGVVYGKKQVPASGYSYVTVDVNVQNPYVGVRGCWPAFWLDTTKSWPPEIDIAEFKGNQGGQVWQNVCNDSQQWQVKQSTAGTGSVHYGLALGPANGGNRTYQLFMNGSIKMQGTFHDSQNSPFWVIANMAMEGDSGSPGPTYNTWVGMSGYVLATH